MEAMPGISLYSYPHLKLAKTLCLLYHCLCLLFNKIGEEGRTGSAWKRGGWGVEGGVGEQGEEMAQTMYAHMNVNKRLKKKMNKFSTFHQKKKFYNFIIFLFCYIILSKFYF
jgi:hypothetical protein